MNYKCRVSLVEGRSFNAPTSGKSQRVKTMNLTQVAALKDFLTHHCFEYVGYDKEAGTVIYKFTLNDWEIQINFGDQCYYWLNNKATGASVRQEFNKVSEVMLIYENVWQVTEDLPDKP